MMKRTMCLLLTVLMLGAAAAVGEEGDLHSLRAMAQRGEAAAVESAALLDFVAGCAPQVQAAVTHEGKVFALPVEVQGWCLCYDPQVLKAMGLTENDLPRSWEEFFVFLTRWNRQWANSGYLPMYPLGLRSSLIYSLFSDYAEAQAAAGSEFKADTPLFRRLLEGLRTADLSRIDHANSTQGVKGYLFAEYDLANLLTQPRLTPWPLALERGGEAVLGAQLRVLAAGDEAALLDELANITPQMRALLAPDTAQPVVNPDFEARQAGQQARLESLRTQQLQGALDVSHQIAQMEEQLSRPEDYRYLLSPQRLTLYRRQLLPLVFLTDMQPLSNAPDDFYILQQRFLQGELTTAQFVKEVDRALKN